MEIKTVELVDAFLASCASRGLSKQTVKWYGTFLKAYGQLYPVLPIEPVAVETFIGKYRGDERRHGAFRTLRTFYNFLEKRLELPNPISKIKPPRRTRKEKDCPTLDEIKTILEFPGHTKAIRAALYALADSGMRIGELHSLESTDIGETSIRVRGKTGERLVPASPKVIKMLRDLGPGKLFTHSVWYFEKEVARGIRAAGFPQFTCHSMRFSFASNWQGSDMALKTIGGWHSWAMLEHYSRRKLEKATKEHATQSPLAKIYGNQDKPSVPAPVIGEALAQYMAKYPEVLGTHTARNLFYLHALLCNIGKNLASIFEEYAGHDTLKDFCAISVLEDVLVKNDIELVENEDDVGPGNEHTLQKLDQGLSVEASALWQSMAMLIEPFIAEHETQANIYRELCGEMTDVERVQFSDLAVIWQAERANSGR